MKITSAAAHVLALSTCLLLSAGECALGATGATIGLNFTGFTERGTNAPPDTMGAVGPDHIVEMLNSVYSVYDKATGSLLQRMGLNDFWKAAGLRGPEAIPIFDSTFDPRVVYDPTVERWYAISANGFDSANTRVNLGVSISSDPTFASNDLTRGWKGFALDGDPVEPNTRSSDFPTLGFDADGVYITTLLISDEGQPFRRDRMIVSIPKADLLLSTPTVVNRSVFDLSGEDLVANCAGSTIQSVVDVGPSDGTASLVYVNATGGMRRWDVASAHVQSPGQATLSEVSQIAIEPFNPAPNAKQPGGAPMLPSGSFLSCPSGGDRDISRFTSALVQQGDSIWGTLAVDAAGRAGVRWYELDAKTGAVRQEGTISDSQLDLIYPSIAVNSFGDAVIGFTATGENTFPSAYASVGKTVGDLTTFGDLMELKGGQGAYTVLQNDAPRWGDYSQTVVDPSDPYSFWTFQEFTQAKDQWAVQVTQILLPGAAPRVDVVAIGPAAAYAARDTASNGVFDDLGNATSDAMGSLTASVRVGETDTFSNRLDRFVVKFELPDRSAASESLENATLRVFLSDIEGTPAGPLSVLHSLTDNDADRVISDYEDASYTDTTLDLFQPTSEIGQYYDVDVTELVRADYAQDGLIPWSAFRLQINDINFLEDGVSHYYLLPSGVATGRPELLLTFVPEPPTSILLASTGRPRRLPDAARLRITIHARVKKLAEFVPLCLRLTPRNLR